LRYAEELTSTKEGEMTKEDTLGTEPTSNWAVALAEFPAVSFA
jgi:hypothetical protein